MMKAEFTNSAEVATLKIYDYVGKYEEVNTENIQNQLDECNGKPLEIYINSYGGEVLKGSLFTTCYEDIQVTRKCISMESRLQLLL